MGYPMLLVLGLSLPVLTLGMVSTQGQGAASDGTTSEGMAAAAAVSGKGFSRIDQWVNKGLRAHAFPGCQVVVLKDGQTVYARAFGRLTYDGALPVTMGTLYDLASLTKTTGTLLAVMKLYDEGLLDLDETAAHYLPFLRRTDKEHLTLRQLLLHESGLMPSLEAFRLVTTKDNLHRVRFGHTNYADTAVSRVPLPGFGIQVSEGFYLNGVGFREKALQRIVTSRLGSPVYRYSCVNFILLKEIVETVSQVPMDVFLDSVFYRPMGLERLLFRPLRRFPKDSIAPTLANDFLRDGPLQGYVHDPDAAFFGGVSGNAGLFGAAPDVAKVYQLLLNGGEWQGRRYLSAKTCAYFTTTVSASGRRGLGFDKPIPGRADSPCCPQAPKEVYGHTGYTGTCCWVDPVNNLVYVFLSNRTYPSDAHNRLMRMGIRTEIQKVIYQNSVKNERQ
jgi:CubicO group peptidase (beta-lactamase class C family)